MREKKKQKEYFLKNYYTLRYTRKHSISIKSMERKESILRKGNKVALYYINSKKNRRQRQTEAEKK